MVCAEIISVPVVYKMLVVKVPRGQKKYIKLWLVKKAKIRKLTEIHRFLEQICNNFGTLD